MIMKTKLPITVIKKSKWRRNIGQNNGLLLDPKTNKMCCLGFDAIRRGCKPRDIRNHGSPEEVNPEKADFSGLVNRSRVNTEICRQLMRINDDDSSIDNNERQERIIKLGRKAGIEFRFVEK